jgi:hypothetical protein
MDDSGREDNLIIPLPLVSGAVLAKAIEYEKKEPGTTHDFFKDLPVQDMLFDILMVRKV